MSTTSMQVRRVQGIRRSGVSGPHDTRPNRRRSRSDARRAAIRESRGI